MVNKSVKITATGIGLSLLLRSIVHVATGTSVRAQIATLIVWYTRKYSIRNAGTVAERLRKNPSVDIPFPTSFEQRYKIEKSVRDGVDVITIRPPNAGQGYILYLHGGAYIRGIMSSHWDFIAFLADSTKSSIVVPLYRLAPQYTIEDTMPVLTDLYGGMEGSITLMGDSAGGGLALALAQVIKKAKLQKPKQIILISPWLDVSLANPAIKQIERNDPWLTVKDLREAGAMWAGSNMQVTDPIVSPLYGDLDDLCESPYMDIIIGTRDLLLVDCQTLAKKKRGGVRLYEYPGMFHVFPLAGFVPEAKRARREIVKILK